MSHSGQVSQDLWTLVASGMSRTHTPHTPTQSAHPLHLELVIVSHGDANAGRMIRETILRPCYSNLNCSRGSQIRKLQEIFA